MIALELKDRNLKITWEIVGIYRVPNEDMRFFEKLADRTGRMGRTTKHCIIGGDRNLPYEDWNSHAEKSRGTQIFLIHWNTQSSVRRSEPSMPLLLILALSVDGITRLIQFES